MNADSTGLTAISISITVLGFGHCIETLIKPIPALGSLGQAEKRGQSREKHSGGGEVTENDYWNKGQNFIFSSHMHIWIKTFHIWIFNNYSPKWRWLVVDIYQAAEQRGKYPTLAADTEVNSCFSIYQNREIIYTTKN